MKSSLLLLYKHFNLNSDCIYYIHDIIINNSAKTIIHYWYSYLKYKMTLIEKVLLFKTFTNTNMFRYYDALNAEVAITFYRISKIFSKIDDKTFLLKHFSLLNNFVEYNNHNVYNKNVYYKMCIFAIDIFTEKYLLF